MFSTPRIRSIETTNSAVCAFELSGCVERADVVAMAEAVNAATRVGRINLLVIARGEATERGERIEAWLREGLADPQNCCRFALVAHLPRSPQDAASLWPRWFAPGREAQAWRFVHAAPHAPVRADMQAVVLRA